jgi:hypothetical protein
MRADYTPPTAPAAAWPPPSRSGSSSPRGCTPLPRTPRRPAPHGAARWHATPPAARALRSAAPARKLRAPSLPLSAWQDVRGLPGGALHGEHGHAGHAGGLGEAGQRAQPTLHTARGGGELLLLLAALLRLRGEAQLRAQAHQVEGATLVGLAGDVRHGLLGGGHRGQQERYQQGGAGEAGQGLLHGRPYCSPPDAARSSLRLHV